MPDPARVGIVVVSHSRTLADAAVVLAREMVQGRELSLAVAAGLDETTLGTDATEIAAAIESVDGGDGVVVLMDLGSAVLSAELALELLADPAAAERVVLSPAPVVEGLVAAVVAAAGGASRAEVAGEAEASLDGKRAHLAPAGGEPAAPSGGGTGEPAEGAGAAGADAQGTATGRFTVANPHGLHARPAARLVTEVRTLPAAVQLLNRTTGAGPVDAGSLSRVTTLGARAGHEVEVTATGEGAQAAVDALLALAARRFDEADPPARPERTDRPDPQDQPDRPGQEAPPAGAVARPAAPGIAVGPVRHLRPAPLQLTDGPPGSVEHETGRLADAVAAVRQQLDRLRATPDSSDAAGIFAAHQLLLEDPALLEPAREAIDVGAAATTAWAAAVEAAEAEVAGVDDDYLRGRAADVRAVGEQVLRALTGQGEAELSGDGVLVARDLTPAETAGLDLERVSGLVLAEGSPTSHAAILARGRGLPALVGAGAAVLDIAEGTVVVLDGGSGALLVDPPPDVLDDYSSRRTALQQQRTEQRAAAAGPARTRDGGPVTVAANLGSLADARTARDCGADGAGLVRTEFLFLGRDDAPDVDEQVAHYLALAEAMDGRRLTFRTLDVGGDKPLPYVPMAAEDNPFLGVRGIRLALARPKLLADQLLALCRVARSTPVGVMFPMVSARDELVRAREALDAAARDGSADGELPAGLEVGIMVEVPAVALKTAVFLPYVDFLSIGTNDLTQYALAADRGNDAVAALSDPLDPGVLGLVGAVCDAARGRAAVAVCGESAADPVAAAVLLGLGVRELSVAPPSVPTVKAAVRELDLGVCGELAARARAMPDAAHVRQAVLDRLR